MKLNKTKFLKEAGWIGAIALSLMIIYWLFPPQLDTIGVEGVDLNGLYFLILFSFLRKAASTFPINVPYIIPILYSFILAILIRIYIRLISKYKWKYVISFLTLALFIFSNDLTRRIYIQARLNQMHLTKETYLQGRKAEEKGVEAYNQKKYPEALVFLLKAADFGFPRAESYLVPFYRRGLGIKKNIPEAIKWFEKSALDEDRFKDTFIGFGFRRGGNKSKMIGQNYENGNWFPKDYGKALKWYQMAYAQGDKGVMRNIGQLYENGHGVPQDYKEAMKWYQKAQKEGENWSLISIGLLYKNGLGVLQNYHEAMRLFLRAEKSAYHFEDMGIPYAGDQDAQNNIGILYEYGLGVPQNYQEAMKWFQKAAYYRYGAASTNIGVLYENGWGVPKDFKEAQRWYQMALSQGDNEAKPHIESLKKFMTK